MKDESNSKEAKIIAVSNQKGGEGKTTISLFLSEALSDDSKVLLIDWDAQANATRLFVNNPEKSIFHCLKYRNNVPISMNVIIKHITENFHLVPSSISLANLTTPFDIEDFELLKDAIEPLKSLYDYIIIDCPPSLGLVLENALIASNYVIIPVQTRAFSVQGLQDLYNSIEKIKKRANPNLKLLGAVLNQYEESRALSGLSKNIRKYFPVFKTIIYRKENIPQAQAKRKLLKGCDPKTRKNFYELAQEMKEYIDVEKNEFGSLDLISVYDEKKETPDKIPISEIISNPNQPRVFGKDNVDDLVESIERLGLIEPIVVRKDSNQYILVAGERRLNAATKLGWNEIPAVITDANPDVCYEMALAENEKRKSLNPWEVGRAIDYLRKEKNKTADEVGKILGYTPRYIKQLNAIARIEQDVVNEFIKKGNEPSIKNLERLLKMQSGEEQPKDKIAPKNNKVIIDLKKIPEQIRADFMEELQNLKNKYGI